MIVMVMMRMIFVTLTTTTLASPPPPSSVDCHRVTQPEFSFRRTSHDGVANASSARGVPGGVFPASPAEAFVVPVPRPGLYARGRVRDQDGESGRLGELNG